MNLYTFELEENGMIVKIKAKDKVSAVDELEYLYHTGRPNEHLMLKLKEIKALGDGSL